MKNKVKKLIITFSIGLNIFLLLLMTIMLYKNWNFINVKNKIINVFSQQNTSVPSYYVEKTDQFRNLEITSDDIVFIGDSITDMGEWVEIFNNPRVKNRGINSDNINGVINRIGDIVKYKPKSIFLMVGTNDLVSSPNIISLSENYEKILNTIKETSPATKVYIQSVLPINSKTWQNNDNTALNNRKQNNESIKLFNSKIEKLAEKHNFNYINLFDKFIDSKGNLNMELSDEGIHLNGKGYMLWKENIEKFIK